MTQLSPRAGKLRIFTKPFMESKFMAGKPIAGKKPIGQRGAFDDLNKQAQKQTSEELVDSRKALYGTFCGRAELTADLMERLQQHPKWPSIPAWGKWALIMLVEKIGRIVEGDPKYDDNWKDISGYAELARRNATGEKA
ncbi:hypothetical protein [Achromobacter phage ewik_TL4]|nr:hypothetical protein [Achromobacter phage hasilly_LB3]WNO48746.1 hypothetical protein [Achromobacter phage nyaak_TL1]WNO48874.1 hypothetical protein [Achromobacter phage kuwaak_TL2]WNO48940.1 hypothetical protein [Achromobacter phage ewii_LB8]WNO49217.1 hypothetical protein [Achromobacter phage ewik_TL4]